jgi:hypothetical protein
MEFAEYAEAVDLGAKSELDKAELIAYYVVKKSANIDFGVNDLLYYWNQLAVPQPNSSRLFRRMTGDGRFPKSPTAGLLRLHANKFTNMDADFGPLFVTTPTPVTRAGGRTLIDPARISELRSLRDCKLDPTRLIRICEEINICYSTECLMAVAVLSRTLINHIPPVFGFNSFVQVVSNYGGSKSFKQMAAKLEQTARNIGDMIAHEMIRPVETLPSAATIDFSQELDVLLGEVVRLLKLGAAAPAKTSA